MRKSFVMFVLAVLFAFAAEVNGQIRNANDLSQATLSKADDISLPEVFIFREITPEII